MDIRVQGLTLAYIVNIKCFHYLILMGFQAPHWTSPDRRCGYNPLGQHLRHHDIHARLGCAFIERHHFS